MEEIIPLEPGKYYHIYNRGNNREDVFREEKNYAYFLQLWGKHIEPVAESYAYCLLKNHFHFMVRIREQPIPKTSEVFKTSEVLKVYNERFVSQQFSNFFNAYTRAFNIMYQRTGRLFQESFQRKPVTDEAYYTHLIQYIHANPQKHGFVDDFRNWPHSSYESYLSEKHTRLMREQVLRWFGGVEEYKSFHQLARTALLEWDAY